MTSANTLQPETRQTDTVRLNLPASHKYLHLLGSCIEGFLGQVDGIADVSTLAYNVQLAAHEICANIVEHAYGGSPSGHENRIEITLSLEAAGTLLVIELRDQGQPFDPSTVPEPILGEPQVHGYGLFLARELMNTVDYRSGPDGNFWRLTKHLYEGATP